MPNAASAFGSGESPLAAAQRELPVVGAGLGRVASNQREQPLALEGVQDGAELRVEWHVSPILGACGNTRILAGSVTMPPLLLASPARAGYPGPVAGSLGSRGPSVGGWSGWPGRFRGSLRSQRAPAEAPGHAVERVPYF